MELESKGHIIIKYWDKYRIKIRVFLLVTLVILGMIGIYLFLDFTNAAEMAIVASKQLA